MIAYNHVLKRGQYHQMLVNLINIQFFGWIGIKTWTNACVTNNFGIQT
jgi:hypothetical protein